MIERIIAYSVRNPFVVIFAAVVVAGLGIHSLINTPIDAIPDLSENQVIVFADWPGRSPKEVEDQVTYPLSVNLQGLAGVKAIRATSEFGFSMINIIFEDKIDFYFARERVLERLSIAETFLPADVSPYLAPDATALGQIFWYTVEGDGYDLGRLRAVQDWYVRYQLYSVPGVAEVASVGGFPIEYQIDVDPNKLRAYDVTLGELFIAVERSNSSVGGRIIQKANSEYLVRSTGWIQSLADVEKTVIKSKGGTPIYVSNVASVQFGSSMRRASLEKNGNEAVGGVVLMRYGENPLEVTNRIKKKIEQLQAGLPEGVRIVPFYERTHLIERAIHTVTSTLREEMIVASLAILLILWHFRSALIVCITLPLAALVSFILMRAFGIPSNIMSLSGIAISIGVLVDSSIVMVENATHHLHARFGNEPVTGDTRELVLPALQTVGRPIFFSVMIMVISFIPVFALGGMEGRMFHPLAFTKTFAMVGVSILAITLVPALIPLLIRGRLRGEEESWIVRSVLEIYRPVLRYLLDHPWPIVLLTGVIFVCGVVPLGVRPLFLFVLGGAMLGIVWAHRASISGGTLYSTPTTLARCSRLAAMFGCLIVVALVADTRMKRLGREFMPPLDEGTVLDMPITIPRASITQVSDDLKARDALLRSFPEVELVVGKAGRAETPTDPAPPDMIETVVNLRPREHWPKRELRYEDAHRQTEQTLVAMIDRGWVKQPSPDQQVELLNDSTMFALESFDHTLRNLSFQEYTRFQHELAPGLTRFVVDDCVRLLRANGKLRREPLESEVAAVADKLAPRFGPRLVESPDMPTVTALVQQTVAQFAEQGLVEASADLLLLNPGSAQRALAEVAQVLGYERATFYSQVLAAIERERDERWIEHVQQWNWRLFDRAVPLYTWQAIEQLQTKAQSLGRWTGPTTLSRSVSEGQSEKTELEQLREQLEPAFAKRLFLWQKSKDGLLKEMDNVLQVPGWGNIWTQPIINRVDMLATGVRTMIGVKVYGDDLNKIQQTSEQIAAVLRNVPGAADVFPDQIVGEGYLEIDIDRDKAARYGVNIGDVQEVIETALGGKMITMMVEGRERFPVRIRYARAFREDEESVKNLLVSAAASMAPVAGGSMSGMGSGGSAGAARLPSDAESPLNPFPNGVMQIPLSQIADVRIAQGPSMIKSENGLLRSYVQLNVRDRDIVGFVEEAERAVADKVKLPAGMYIEWSGQFEHQLRAKRTLTLIVPIVVMIIFVLLYITYHDFTDALLMMLAVPGALAGGVLFQYLFGFNFSVAVWVGFIACFGLATETGVVMLVYLREAVAQRGGLENIASLPELKLAIMEGAVHRLRPKLLTEGTTIIGLAPMLWATGTGAEIMQPMAAPVLGGILVADEVIDLLLPVLFYHLRARRWRKLHAASVAEGESTENAPV
ncbi:MAG: efflux RND transporter permease subunit [Planctomycetota bacterium]|nr:efflux RND transporter permease subunit [Planctomycetota bacterium]